MRKTKLILILIVMFSFILISINASAVPTDGNGDVINNTSGFSWIDAPYWTGTDLTNANGGEAVFQLQIEKAAYESDFGIFTPNDLNNPTNVDTEFEIYEKSDEPNNQKSVYFQKDNSNWEVSLDQSTWTNFDNVFGFYFGVDSNGDSATNYKYYSDWNLNTVDQGDQHVAIEYDGSSEVKIYLEDLRTDEADWDWKDMTTSGDNLKPVPEPATMLLLGTGLLGLAGICRKKFLNKKG